MCIRDSFAGDVTLAATKKLYLDGGGTTYIYESSDGVIDFYGDTVQLLTAKQNGTQSEVVVNEGSGDVDFRVEANNDTHAFFVEAEGAGKVGIGTNSPNEKLHIYGGHLEVQNTGNTNIYINAQGNSDATLFFQEANSAKAKVQFDSSNDSLLLTDGEYNDTMTLKGQKVGIGTTSPDEDLEINRSNASPTLIVKASGQTSSTAPTASLFLSPGSFSANTTAPRIIGYRTADFSSAAARSAV